MKVAFFFIAAVVAYLVGSLNPAIILSKLIYHEDIRRKGSNNPGFTNFKRVYGMKFAWLVLLLDILKAVILEIIFGFSFKKIFATQGDVVQKMNFYALGVSFTGLFAILGHSFPVWYKFQGGKAFLVCIATLFMLNWKAGLIAFILLSIFLLSTHYMSLSVIIALIAGAVSLIFVGTGILETIFFALSVLFVIYRHKENIKRLFDGTETKFYFFKKTKDPTECDNDEVVESETKDFSTENDDAANEESNQNEANTDNATVQENDASTEAEAENAETEENPKKKSKKQK